MLPKPEAGQTNTLKSTTATLSTSAGKRRTSTAADPSDAAASFGRLNPFLEGGYR